MNTAYTYFNAEDANIHEFQPKRPDDEFQLREGSDWFRVNATGPFQPGVNYRRKKQVKFSYPTSKKF